MAKKFAGFTPQQMAVLLPKVGYTGNSMQSDEVNAFLAANPAAAAKMGKYTLAARRAIEGEPVRMADGGYASYQAAVDKAQAKVADKRNALSAANQALAANPSNTSLKSKVDSAQAALTAAEAELSTAQQNLASAGTPTTTETTAAALSDPTSLVTTADVATISDEDKAAGTIAEGTGQLGEAATGEVTTAAPAAEVAAPTVTPAATVTAETAAEGAQATLDTLTAATGKPSDEALAEAATMSPDQLASLGLTVDQIAEAQRVQAPEARTVQAGELISGPTVDMEKVRKEVNFAAATGAPSSDATVQGQLTGLMEQFEGKEPPAWAAGAMRAAAAQMAARGLGSSSMAGQAIIQSAMESALPIAMQDAQTSATFELQNLSNKQQSAMFAAEKRAEFLGMEFTQAFQTRVANAAKISDIANMNFNAEQQIALENARMAQTVDLANLDARNAKIMADAAAMSQLDLTNLSNRQQAAVQAAQAFLQMDMKNLDNQQQTAVFKTQEMLNVMLSDTAARNAAAQFNATSENQTNQFFASLSANVAQFNVEQANAMNRFNAGEANAMSQFNAAQVNLRDQFNANNQLLIAQANAQWFQNITTMENAAQNQANRDAAMAANNMTMTAYNNRVQRERDLLAWAWQSSENASQRNADLGLEKFKQAGAKSSALSGAAGTILSEVFSAVAKKIILS